MSIYSDADLARLRDGCRATELHDYCLELRAECDSERARNRELDDDSAEWMRRALQSEASLAALRKVAEAAEATVQSLEPFGSPPMMMICLSNKMDALRTSIAAWRGAEKG
jgi:nucleotide-binding universal stress UspA family protein